MIRSAISSGCSTTLVAWLSNAGDDDASGRQLHAVPHLPLVLMARVGALDHVGSAFTRRMMLMMSLSGTSAGMQAGPASPADVITDAILRNAFQRHVDDVDLMLEPAEKISHRSGRHHAVRKLTAARVVELHQQPCSTIWRYSVAIALAIAMKRDRHRSCSTSFLRSG